MFNDYSKMDKKKRQFFRSMASSTNGKTNRRFTSEEIKRLFFDHPELRFTSNPSDIELAKMLMVDGEDGDLQEMFGLIVDNRNMEFIGSGDVFWGNYPCKNEIKYPADFMALGDMPTGDPIGLVTSQLNGNVGFIGPTKSGKTTLLSSWLSSSPELLKTTCIIALVKKPELRHLSCLQTLYDFIRTFVRNELALSLCQNPQGVPELAWRNELQRLIGQCYARYSSQRLFGDIVDKLTASHPDGVFPTLRQIAEVLNDFRPRFGMREASYKESILWCLTDLLNSSGGIWDYSSSDFLEQLFSRPGLNIIELPDLPQEHFTFIATYLMRWLYFKRLYTS